MLAFASPFFALRRAEDLPSGVVAGRAGPTRAFISWGLLGPDRQYRFHGYGSHFKRQGWDLHWKFLYQRRGYVAR